MADDRSLKDVIRFLDPSGSISDADIATVTKDLKFTEVLDLITNVGKDKIDDARNILAKYDSRFAIAQEYSSVPTTNQNKFKPIRPTGSSTTPTTTGQEEESSIDDLVNDPKKQNDPNVRQIKNLLQRMQR